MCLVLLYFRDNKFYKRTGRKKEASTREEFLECVSIFTSWFFPKGNCIKINHIARRCIKETSFQFEKRKIIASRYILARRVGRATKKNKIYTYISAGTDAYFTETRIYLVVIYKEQWASLCRDVKRVTTSARLRPSIYISIKVPEKRTRAPRPSPASFYPRAETRRRGPLDLIRVLGTFL